MIYIISPYSHPDRAVREHRFREACRATAALLRDGETAFSPIVHGHPLVQHGLPTGWRFWERFAREHLNRCDQAIVLMLDGWEESEGVRDEICLAMGMGIPVRFLDVARLDEGRAASVDQVIAS